MLLRKYPLVNLTLHQHTYIRGVLGPGLWDTRRLAKLAAGYSNPGPKTPPYICV